MQIQKQIILTLTHPMFVAFLLFTQLYVDDIAFGDRGVGDEYDISK